MKLTSLIAALSLVGSAAFAGSPEIFTGRFSDLAVGGFDPVAYFEDGKPIKGSKEFALQLGSVENQRELMTAAQAKIIEL